MSEVLQAAKVSSDELGKVTELATALPDGSALGILLEHIVEAVGKGEDVSIFTAGHELTPNQAAEVLRVSRPHLLKLMNKGLIAYRLVGTHRRISMADLMDYIDRHERASSMVAHAVGTRTQAEQQVRDEARSLTEEDMALLNAL